MTLFSGANHLLLKLILAPLIISAATLISRRWGERIGGLIVGLPLTSAPVSVFFTLEQGRSFAASAAKNAMEGLIPVAIFCIGYALTAKKATWVTTAALSVVFYVVTVLGISFFDINLTGTLILVVGILILANMIIGHPPSGATRVEPVWWDIPLRMLIASAMLIFITTAAGLLGSRWSGLLSPFPIFTFVMATFSHSQVGSDSAWKLLRGILIGLFSYAAFFLIVGLFVSNWSLWLVYIVAAMAAVSINGLSLLFLLRH